MRVARVVLHAQHGEQRAVAQLCQRVLVAWAFPAAATLPAAAAPTLLLLLLRALPRYRWKRGNAGKACVVPRVGDGGVVVEARALVQRGEEYQRLGALRIDPTPQHACGLQQTPRRSVRMTRVRRLAAAAAVAGTGGARHADGALLVEPDVAVERGARQARPAGRAVARPAYHCGGPAAGSRCACGELVLVPQRRAAPAGVVGVRVAHLDRAQRAAGRVEELVDRALAALARLDGRPGHAAARGEPVAALRAADSGEARALRGRAEPVAV